MNNLFLVIFFFWYLTCINNILPIYCVYLKIVLTHQSKGIDINICHMFHFFCFLFKSFLFFSLSEKHHGSLSICLSFLVWITCALFDHLLIHWNIWQICIEHPSCSQTGLSIGIQADVFPALWSPPLSWNSQHVSFRVSKQTWGMTFSWLYVIKSSRDISWPVLLFYFSKY